MKQNEVWVQSNIKKINKINGKKNEKKIKTQTHEHLQVKNTLFVFDILKNHIFYHKQ